MCLGITGAGDAMGRAYSADLRVRVVDAIAAGASRRATARLFAVSVSSAIRWAHRWRETGSVAPRPLGGVSRSPLEAHDAWLLALIDSEPDLTLEEVRTRLRERGVATAASSVWRFFERRGISFKKNAAGERAGACRRRCGA
jgi:transposase